MKKIVKNYYKKYKRLNYSKNKFIKSVQNIVLGNRYVFFGICGISGYCLGYYF